jgi:hypothetical protein
MVNRKSFPGFALMVLMFISAGRHYWGLKGMIVFPAIAILLFFLLDIVGTAWMVKRYYWNNPYRSRWNAFCYLHGWVQEGDKNGES